MKYWNRLPGEVLDAPGMPVFETLGQHPLKSFRHPRKGQAVALDDFCYVSSRLTILFYCIVFNFIPFYYFAKSNLIAFFKQFFKQIQL